MTVMQLFDTDYLIHWADFFSLPAIQILITAINDLVSETTSPLPCFAFRAFENTKPDEIKAVLLGTVSKDWGISYCNKDGSPIHSNLKEAFGNNMERFSFRGVFMCNVQFTSDESMKTLWIKFTSILINYISKLPQKPSLIICGAALKKFSKPFDGKNVHVLPSYKTKKFLTEYNLVSDLLPAKRLC